jgi:AraC family carnitine catabolism transcriptional activator
VAASSDIRFVSAAHDIGCRPWRVVSASYEPERGTTRPVLAAIRKLARDKVLLAGIDTGPFLLAEAGVLDGTRATCHWESLPGFRESYPQVQATQALYEIDRGRMTCAGGAAAIDMMLEWIGRLLGRPLAVTVADQLVHFRYPDGERQARVRAGDMAPAIRAFCHHRGDGRRARAARCGGAGPTGVFGAADGWLFAKALTAADGLRGCAAGEGRAAFTYARERAHVSRRGFSSLAQFSRAFKAKRGRPPSRLRRSASVASPFRL